MPKKDDCEKLGDKIDELSRRMEGFEAFEASVDKVVAQNLDELRFLAYATVVMLAILLFFFLGNALKQMGL
ncbi:hypothetical protein AUJ65_05580 [Candidatus Micrarchaeota archaeon CG1_02_51_15]|nr:MAG: hypothetical protein AUJ65_05580 [Candidatus Micrarchaeota archaeon CG1_02_51_15]